MGLFRTLSNDDVRGLCAAFGAPVYLRHESLPAGTINTNLRVATAAGPFFLRVNEGKQESDVLHEAAIVEYLALRGVPTPAPMRARDGRPFVAWQGQLVSLFPWVEGRVLRRAEIAPDHARQAGEALGRLHLAGADSPDRARSRYEPDEIARRLEAASRSADPEMAGAVAALRPELTALGAGLFKPVPEGLIHGDLFVDNVLYRDDGGLVALLDFEQASWGRFVYDMAVTVLAFGFGVDDFRRDVTRALIDGYAAVRRPDPAESAVFGAELRFAACRFTVTRITDVHMRRAAGAPAGKDFRRYLARLRRVQEHLAAHDGLFDLPD